MFLRLKTTTFAAVAACGLSVGVALPAAADEGFAPDAPAVPFDMGFDDDVPEPPRLARRGGKRGKRGKGKLSPEERQEMKKRFRKKMHTYLTVELSSRLDLDDKKTMQLSAALKKHGQQVEAHHQQMRDASKALRKLLDEGAPDAQVKKQLDVVTEAAEQRPSPRALVKDTKGFLSVKQQAQLALAMPEVMKEMKHMMRRERRKMRGGGGFRGGPDGDFGAPPPHMR